MGERKLREIESRKDRASERREKGGCDDYRAWAEGVRSSVKQFIFFLKKITHLSEERQAPFLKFYNKSYCEDFLKCFILLSFLYVVGTGTTQTESVVILAPKFSAAFNSKCFPRKEINETLVKVQNWGC